MSRPHSNLTDYEYWDLRLRLFDLQRGGIASDADYEEIKRDLMDDLHNYLIVQTGEQDPWN